MTASASRGFAVLTSILGVFLLVTAFAGDWFEVSGNPQDMWQSFSVVDVFVAASALIAIAAGPAAILAERQGLAVTLATISANFAVLATLLLIWRTIDPPGDQTVRELGFWVGLGLQVGVLVGSFAAMGGGSPPRLSSTR